MWTLWVSVALGATVESDPNELLHLARERIRHGDFVGVRILADQALRIPGDHHGTAEYLVAVSWEYDGEPERALAMYDALLTRFADHPDDLLFRRAECLGRLERYDDARTALRALGRSKDRAPTDQLKIDVLSGLWDLQVGKDRRGLETLERALVDAPPDDVPWYQAQARHGLLSHAVEVAAELKFEGSDRAKKVALEQRAAMLTVADEQLVGLVRLDEPTFALEGFLLVGGAYRDLGRDLLNESPLPKLEAGALEINRSLLRDRVEIVWTKGTRYYDRGLQLAAIQDWTQPPVPALHAAYDALVAEVDGLRAP